MQIVIDITEEEYRRCQDLTNLEYDDVVDFLRRVEDVLDDENCVILPKGHGKLIDADTIALVDENFISQSDYIEAECAVDNAPTVIEADEEN